ncbi:MAG: hypothetical protein EBZ77_05260, partial [Chitinophagia bacterium]|nr:hypothetical protein [Chitinophagia bacterium]
MCPTNGYEKNKRPLPQEQRIYYFRCKQLLLHHLTNNSQPSLMAQTFIVRPFGKKPVYKTADDGATSEKILFDFDRVEAELIKPAMMAVGLLGGTTGEVFEAGDIREDMFSELLLADIVIADITIHNANVFYELGIRHALRDKRTVLIKCDKYDQTPFDILGYRYLSYDENRPGEAVEQLKEMLTATRDTERVDSPVFKTLPKLNAQDLEYYLAVPEGFQEEVEIARSAQQLGKLMLLASEADTFPWKMPAMRIIGESLFKLKAFPSAMEVWEKVRAEKPADLEANDRLATIYHRLGEKNMDINPEAALQYLAQSDIAIKTMIHCKDISSEQLAEVYALKARNAKTTWLFSLKGLSGSELAEAALQSADLRTAIDYYKKGFKTNLNHFYSGINALGLITVLLVLADRF